MCNFDLEIVGEDYFIDPNEIEHPVIEQFGVLPNWEELYEDGYTSFTSKDGNISVFMSTNNVGESVSVDIWDDWKDDYTEVGYKYFQIIMNDCFAEICIGLLDRVQQILEENHLTANAA